MTDSHDATQALQQQVNEAISTATPMVITAGGTKQFYGNSPDGDALEVSTHRGIIEYQPSELVVTVRSGTRLSELDAILAENKQMLAFEPPLHGNGTTIGGVIACGLSGPRRVSSGSARDFVLGTTIINGKGEHCRFGGQVMKNVAGYDASRLMVGAQGTLGVMLDISLKVLPLSETEVSIKIDIAAAEAINALREWVKQGHPVSASCIHQNALTLRLSSTHSAVKQALTIIGQQYSSAQIDNDYWLALRDQNHEFFTTAGELWRCSHLSDTPLYETDKEQLLEWNGALRWIKSDSSLHRAAADQGGHATRYPLHDDTQENIFQPLTPAMMKIHRNLKQAFDPAQLFNKGRLYTEL